MNYKYFKPTQTREEIKNEYRRLAKLMHPDLGGNTADSIQIAP
jgi:curved DNA-binding protein CbpA